MFKFEKIAVDPASAARAGKISTDHGEILTPIFMPVGTVGSVKGVYHRDLENDIKAQIILGNTYHLYLRPGLDTLFKAGGLHKFEHWDRPILTDSGGFQVFSLAPIRKLTEEGCKFSSHIDGSKHIFTPENNVETQRKIGADIIMALDECCPGDADLRYATKSLRLTQGWLERFARHFDETEPLYGYQQVMFPIIQGCVYPELRRQAVEHALGLDNALVCVDGGEIPILDGSARPFAEAMMAGGLVPQDADRDPIVVTRSFRYTDRRSGAFIGFEPADRFSVEVTIDYPSRVIGVQHARFDAETDYLGQIAPCRTFCFRREVALLRLTGLIRGGSLENALVVDEPRGYVGDPALFFEDEPARHKLLDLLGDLSLAGRPIRGRVVAYKPGHRVNTRALEHFLAAQNL